MDVATLRQEPLLDRLRRENPALKKLLVVNLLPGRLKKALTDITQRFLLEEIDISDEERAAVFQEIERRVEGNPSCWSPEQMAELVENHLLPVLRSAALEPVKEPVRTQVKPKKPKGPPRKLLKPLHKATLGFASVSQLRPVVFMGNKRDVADALRHVLEDNALTLTLHFSNEEPSQGSDDISFSQRPANKGRMEIRSEASSRRARVFRSGWNFCLHKQHYLNLVATRLEEKLGCKSFDLLVVDDIGVDPVNLDPETYRAISPRRLSRADEVCRRLRRWSMATNAAVVVGLVISEKESYRQVELARLKEFCQVYHVAEEEGALQAKDDDGHTYEIGE